MDVFAQVKAEVEAAVGRLVRAGRLPEGLSQNVGIGQ